MKQGPVLFQFALTYQGKHRDGGIFPVLASTGRDHLSRIRLLGPLRSQALVRFVVVAKIARRFQQKISIHDPESAIYRGADLEDQSAVFHLACLLNISCTRRQELAMFMGVAPLCGSKWLPLAPEFARLG